MNYEVVKILNNLSAGFAQLAEELEKQEVITNTRLTVIEEETMRNKKVLLNIADMIHNNLD